MEAEQTAGKWVEKWQLGMRQAGLSGSASAARKYRRASLRVARGNFGDIILISILSRLGGLRYPLQGC